MFSFLPNLSQPDDSVSNVGSNLNFSLDSINLFSSTPLFSLFFAPELMTACSTTGYDETCSETTYFCNGVECADCNELDDLCGVGYYCSGVTCYPDAPMEECWTEGWDSDCNSMYGESMPYCSAGWCTDHDTYYGCPDVCNMECSDYDQFLCDCMGDFCLDLACPGYDSCTCDTPGIVSLDSVVIDPSTINQNDDINVTVTFTGYDNGCAPSTTIETSVWGYDSNIYCIDYPGYSNGSNTWNILTSSCTDFNSSILTSGDYNIYVDLDVGSFTDSDTQFTVLDGEPDSTDVDLVLVSADSNVYDMLTGDTVDINVAYSNLGPDIATDFNLICVTLGPFPYELINENFTYGLGVDSNYYDVAMVVPMAGEYDVNCYLISNVETDSNILNDWEVMDTLVVSDENADLQMDEMTLSDGSIEIGESVDINCIYTNNGPTIADDFNIILKKIPVGMPGAWEEFGTGNNWQSDSRLANGASSYHVFTVDTVEDLNVAGTYTISCFVDGIADDNSNNDKHPAGNFSGEALTITEPVVNIDLVLNAVDLNTYDVNAGDSVDINIRYSNLGPGTATDFNLICGVEGSPSDIVNENFTYGLGIDSNYYDVAMVVPSAGEYDLNCYLVSNEETDTNSLNDWNLADTLTAHEPLTNEVDLNATLDSNVEELAFGETADFNCIIYNAGPDTASDYNVRLYLDGEPSEMMDYNDSLESLAMGESSYAMFYLPYNSEEMPTGEYYFYCRVESDDDTNLENNNSEIITVALLEGEPLSHGSGTEEDPYQVYTLADLNAVRNYLDANFVLMNDLDCFDTKYWTIDAHCNFSSYDDNEAYCEDNGGTWYEDYNAGWRPIGNDTNFFTGSFNGNGHTISNLYSYWSDLGGRGIGLFGYSSGNITNIGVVDANLSGEQYIGGIVGYNTGVVSNCYADATVYATVFYAGGLVGENTGENAVISNSYAMGSVTAGWDYFGGFVGYNDVGTITNSYSTAVVADYHGFSGGFNFGSTISNCFWDIEASGADHSQGEDNGETGKTTEQMKSRETFDAVLDFPDTWGINSNDNNGYPFLAWQGYEDEGELRFSGGVGSVSNPYRIATLEDLNSIRGHYLEGQNFVLVADINMYETRYWNFVPAHCIFLSDHNLAAYNNEEDCDGNGHHWAEDSNYGWVPIGANEESYDYFIGTLDGNNHTISDVYISTSDSSWDHTYGGPYGQEQAYEGVVGLFRHINTSSLRNLNLENFEIYGFVLERAGTLAGSYSSGEDTNITNVNATGNIYVEYTTGYGIGGLIGTSYGTVSESSFDGNVIGYSYAAGLIGANSGTIVNCHSSGYIEGKLFSEDYAYAYRTGGLVAVNTGSILLSYSDATVTGNTSIGGLVGENLSGSEISSSYSLGTVNALSNGRLVGGLVGYNDGEPGQVATITNSYSFSDVNGDEEVGGLVGKNDSDYTVSKCYSAGLVTGVSSVGGLVGYDDGHGASTTNSFWDTETSGQLTSDGGTGKTTIEMKDQNTFTSATWNFDTTWAIDGFNMDGYPYLIGQDGLLEDMLSADSITFDPNGIIFGNTVDVNFIYSNPSEETNANDFNVVCGVNIDEWFTLSDENNVSLNAGDSNYLAFTTIAIQASNEYDINCYLITNGEEVDVYLENNSIVETLNVYESDLEAGAITFNPETPSSVDENVLITFNYSVLDGNLTSDYNIVYYIDDEEVANYQFSDDLNTEDSDSNGYYLPIEYRSGNFDINVCLAYNNELADINSDNDCNSATLTIEHEYNGLGTENDPYQIGNIYDLNALRNYFGAIGDPVYFKVMDDIDMYSATREGGDFWNDGNGWEPINSGSLRNMIFVGNNKTINGLYINRSTANNVGLFGSVTYISVENLTLTNVNVTGNRYVGSLAGSLTLPASSHAEFEGILNNVTATGLVTSNSGQVGGVVGYLVGYGPGSNVSTDVTNCSFDGNIVSSGDYAGGLFGYVSSSGGSYDLNNSFSSGSVTSSANYVGGLVGYLYYAPKEFYNNYSSANVSGTSYVGGLVGYVYSTTTNISYCYATGNVDATTNYAGGLIGRNLGNVYYSFATGNVYIPNSGDKYSAGGLIGYNESSSNLGGIVTNCYARGSVSGRMHVGGLIGSDMSDNSGNSGVSKSYSTGLVTGSSDYGGLIGYKDVSANITDSFYDTTTSGRVDTGKGTPKTTAEMKTLSTFTDAGWDFDTVWDMNELLNDGYPYLVPILSSDNILVAESITFTPTFGFIGDTVDVNFEFSNSATSSDATDFNIVCGVYLGESFHVISDLNNQSLSVGDTNYFGFTTNEISSSDEYDFNCYLLDNTSIDDDLSDNSILETLNVYEADVSAGAITFTPEAPSQDDSNVLITFNYSVLDGNLTSDYNIVYYIDDEEVANYQFSDDLNTGDSDSNDYYYLIEMSYGEHDVNVCLIFSEELADANSDNDCNSAIFTITPIFTGGGNGTEEDPFVIGSAEDLNLINEHLDANFVLESDVNMYDDTRDGGVFWNDGNGWDPIGDDTNSFTGSFDGNGHEITGVYINRSEDTNVGFFGDTNGADIIDVNLTDSNITGFENVGGLVGSATDTNITNSHTSDGDVNGTNNVGGLAGYIDNTDITDSNSDVNVNGNGNNVGGLIGEATNDSNITNSHFTGDVTNTGNNTGGLIGSNDGGDTINSSSIGDVTSDGNYVGGLIGYNNGGDINGCNSTGDVTGDTNVGGLSGYNNGGNINDSNFSGNVTSTGNNAGGLTGSNIGGDITNSHTSDGDVNGTNNVGGLAGYIDNTNITDSNSDVNVNGNGNNVGGLVGEATNDSNITNSHFTGEVTNTGGNVGGLVGSNVGGDINGCSSTGDITGEGNNIGGLVGFVNDSNITDSYFDGNVINLSTGDYVGGLVGYMEYSIIVDSSSSGTVISQGNYVGGLSGSVLSSIITDSYSTADVSNEGQYVAGGLVGEINDTNVLRCYATGDVNAAGTIGGLIGYVVNDSNITNSYARGNSGNESSIQLVGGLIGPIEDSTVTNSYHAGQVISLNAPKGLIYSCTHCTVTNSFWDEELSGIELSDGGTGKTTLEMQTETTFTDANWDFNEVWGINAGYNDGYPYLLWEGFEGSVPDMNAISITFTPASVIYGDEDNDVNLSFTFNNIGDVNADENFVLTYYVADVNVGSTTISTDLNAGDQITWELAWTPDVVGLDLNVSACVEYPNDSNSDNDCVYSEDDLNIYYRDLNIEDFSIDDNAYFDSNVDFNILVTNNGTYDSNNVDVYVWILEDANNDNNFLLETFTNQNYLANAEATVHEFNWADINIRGEIDVYVDMSLSGDNWSSDSNRTFDQAINVLSSIDLGVIGIEYGNDTPIWGEDTNVTITATYENSGVSRTDEDYNILFYVNDHLERTYTNSDIILSDANTTQDYNWEFAGSIGDQNIMVCVDYNGDVNPDNNCSEDILTIYYREVYAGQMSVSGTLIYGETETITVTVGNSGNYDSNGVAVSLDINGLNADGDAETITFTFDDQDLLANTSVDLNVQWDINLVGVLDFNLIVVPVDADNNSITDYNYQSGFDTSYYVDLVSEISIDEDVNVGHYTDINCTVENLGTTDTDYNYTIYLYVDGEEYDSEIVSTVLTIPTIVEDLSYTSTFSWRPTQKTTHDFNCVVDYNGTDYNLANNSATSDLNVTQSDTNVDLGVASIELSKTTEGTITVDCNIGNLSEDTNATSDFNVIFYKDDVYVDSEDVNEDLNFGDYTTVSFSWIAEAGDYNLQCVVDYNVNDFNGYDANLDNNSYIEEVTITAIDDDDDDDTGGRGGSGGAPRYIEPITTPGGEPSDDGSDGTEDGSDQQQGQDSGLIYNIPGEFITGEVSKIYIGEPNTKVTVVFPDGSEKEYVTDADGYITDVFELTGDYYVKEVLEDGTEVNKKFEVQDSSKITSDDIIDDKPIAKTSQWGWLVGVLVIIVIVLGLYYSMQKEKPKHYGKRDEELEKWKQSAEKKFTKTQTPAKPSIKRK